MALRGLSLVVVVAVIGSCCSSAIAAEPQAFDPALSLTGNCSVSVLDPVLDPGLCPMPPGVPGVDHPEAAFSKAGGVATDSYGNIYVTSTSPEQSKQGRIDVFDSSGHFITEVKDPEGPQAVAVDSEGYLYVSNVGWEFPKFGVVRYDPNPATYEPATGEIEYSTSSTGVVENTELFHGLALDPATDHLFVKESDHVAEYKAAAEGNGLIENFGFGVIGGGEDVGIAVDRAHGRLYVGTGGKPGCSICIYVLNLEAPHEVLSSIEGSAVPGGKFTSSVLSLAADEGSGSLFVYDGEAAKVFEFDEAGTYLATIEHGFEYNYGSEIGVDNGENSPNGKLNPKGRYLFVPSASGAKGGGTNHSYAFGPPTKCEPVVKSVSFDNVGEREAELQADIEPCLLPTHYVIDYLTQQQFDEQGGSFVGAQVAGEGDIPAEASPVSVAAAATNLSSETSYRFRVVATNELGSDERQGEFSTYLASEEPPDCPNATLRTGLSALLPDCRAYELVTPPSTNAHTPVGAGVFPLGPYFSSPQASPAGSSVSFNIEGGTIPDTEATGSLAGDPYVASRGDIGWSTAYTGPNSSEVTQIVPGSNSPDQGYSFWTAQNKGSAVVEEGKSASYVRYPDGHSALIGRGSIGSDPQAQGNLISENGGHIVFVSATFEEFGIPHPAVQLEPNAPPDGTTAIYDRTADEVTHVVSLLPGDETPKAGENASYKGVSLDGRGVAFTIGTILYLRYNNEETFEIGPNVTFAGVAEGGIFYLEGGKLWRFDAASGERIAFSSGAVTPVNVSADGTTAYFVSTKVLTTEANPNGAKAANGQENLYRSEEGQVSFVGTVTERDVKGESNVNGKTGGLGLWTTVITSTSEGGAGRFAADPSRTTPDGNALLFESRAALAGYDPQGHAEVYRYDFAGNSLQCLSCNPTLAPATSAASLQSISVEPGSPEPLSAFSYLANLRADGNRAFFQSSEALVSTDTDKLQDVYEWETQGVGSCNRPGGCVYLISAGQSNRADYLYGVSGSGEDVFFSSKDRLLAADLEETPSIYDARVDGGFAESCVGEECQPLLPPSPPSQTPPMPSLATQGVGKSGNVGGRTCSKGKRKVRRHGKVRCVKKHKKHHHRKAGTTKKGGRK